MKSETKCDDQNSLSKEERKQKKEERRNKKMERLKVKQNSTDVEQPCEDAAKNTSLDAVTESSKKRNKRKKHNSDSVDDEIDCERITGEHSKHGNGKIKRQKTEDIEQITSTNCDSSLAEIKSNKTKRKKEKTISIDSSSDTNQPHGISQDIAQSTKKKNKKHKKSKAESSDGENVMPAKIDSTLLQMDSDINHEKKSKKQNQKGHGTNEEIDDTKHTDSKENHSSPTKEQHSKKKKKHSKHKDCESTDETDGNISRKIHKKKSKSASFISGNDEVQGKGNTDECDSVKAQDIMKHVASDLNISNTGDEQRSKHHKKQKNRSKNSPTASMVMNTNGKEELCSETSACGRPTSDQMIKSEQSPACAAAAHGNWQGNLFESGERQNKFLRLLGGMKKSNDTEKSKGSATLAGTKKKGLFGSLASLSSTASSGSSAALDVNAAASLNQKLEDEYNKAMNFKLSGKVGTGFGFVQDPAKGKTFHIDVNQSKSMKFDDD